MMTAKRKSGICPSCGAKDCCCEEMMTEELVRGMHLKAMQVTITMYFNPGQMLLPAGMTQEQFEEEVTMSLRKDLRLRDFDADRILINRIY